MTIECNLLISLLKLTKEGPALIESVKDDDRLPSTTTLKLLKRMQSEGLVYLEQNAVKVESDSRLKIAVKAVSLGADVELVSKLLCWQEFEEIAAVALRNNGYVVSTNVRFKHGGHRWEIDVVGCKKPSVICIDCKHWQHAIAPSTLKRIVEAQVERTIALCDLLPNRTLSLECSRWSSAKFFPAILSLMPSAMKFYDRVPIVPILQVQDFISQLPVYAESLRFFYKKFSSLSHNL